MRTTVALNINTGDRRKYRKTDCCVEAAGPLSIHRTIQHPSYWTITHNASGMAFTKVLKSRAQARALAGQIKQTFKAWGIDLNTLTSITWPKKVLSKAQHGYMSLLLAHPQAGLVKAEEIAGRLPE